MELSKLWHTFGTSDTVINASTISDISLSISDAKFYQIGCVYNKGIHIYPVIYGM